MGPYVNHIGLIIFLVGAMLRFFPGMYVDANMWFVKEKLCQFLVQAKTIT